MTPRKPAGGLRKELGLFDVYAISTGAMFSSGFFLLPGLAAAQTGPSVALAYLVAGLFILPAMFSVAELATAMPRAGGAYYFLDRSMGPLMGTVGGLGGWVAMVLKSAFALVGVGAYLALYLDVPIEPLAVALAVVFGVVNVVGAKETAGLQRFLVTALLAILSVFVLVGLAEIHDRGVVQVTSARFTPFFAFGLAGFVSTVGFVFVSYAGLTKVASVAEEVRDPDRNLPLGMMLSLATAAVVYSVGVYILVALLPAADLRQDLTPVASAAAVLFVDTAPTLGPALIVVAAIAAFASTGNAGVLAASRFPLAMARDRLVPTVLGKVGRFHTPTTSVVVTTAFVIAAIVFLDVEGIAKLASAFLLLLYALLSLAVVIMRESRIEGYDPGYRSPLYPWMQIFGILAPAWLITEMGQMAILFTLGLVAATVVWYVHYAHDRVERAGAIYHTFARLGERRHAGLDRELRGIVREKGLRSGDPFEDVVARAAVLDFPDPVPFSLVVADATATLEGVARMPAPDLAKRFHAEMDGGFLPLAHGTALPHLRVPGLRRPHLLLARAGQGLLGIPDGGSHQQDLVGVQALLFLLSPKEDPGQHLRLLGHLASLVDDESFLPRWLEARGPGQLKATLLHEERSATVLVAHGLPTSPWIGAPLKDVGLPKGTLVALVRRGTEGLVPDGATVLGEGDHLTVIGSPQGIREIVRRFGTVPSLGDAAGRPATSV
ncbi:MAG: amino acid transporter [Gemmatimonadota bacterium]